MRIRKKHILLSFTIWSFIAVLHIASNYFQGMFWEKRVNWDEVIPFASAWYLWFFFSFPVAIFANRYSYAEISTKRFLLYHFLFFLCINGIHIVVASAYIDFMLETLTKEDRKSIVDKLVISGSFYNLIIYGVMVVVLNSIKYYRDLQSERNNSLVLQKQLTDRRMSFLKQQLQPHFLFNAHHSVITLMKIGEKKKSIEIMEKLSDLMRFSLKENSNIEITLEKELHLLQLYLDIQKVRFEDKLRAAFHTDVKLNEALVPSMILQPLVENSIKYAVERSSSPSVISISAYQEDHYLVLSVEDSTMEEVVKNIISKGIGLTNTEERLKTMYGKQQQFEFRRVDLDGLQGWKVTIKIPLHYA